MSKFFNYIKVNSIFFSMALISGVLVGTSYIPFNGWALLFCYLPLWLSALKNLEKVTLKTVFFAGWITQFVLTAIGFNWIYYVTKEFGGFNIPMSAGVLVLFAAFMHLYIPAGLVAALAIIKKFRVENNLPRLLIIALCFSLIERIWPSIFEWNLAYTLLWIKNPIFQWADTIGFWGLSTLIFITQAIIGYTALEYKTSKTNKVKCFISLALLIFGLCFLFFTGKMKHQKWSNTNQSVKMAIAQGNIGNAEKTQSEQGPQYHDFIRNKYSSLTESLYSQQPFDIMLWPETAMPFAFDKFYHQNKQQSLVLQLAQKLNTYIVTGGYSLSITEKDIFGGSLFRNAAFYISPYLNEATIPYYKTNLLVFGEYMPLGKQLPILYKLLPFVGIYGEGSGPQIAEFKLNNQKLIKLGPQICYDSLVPSFSRKLSLNGAEILYNLTNDAWFGWWAEPFQHGYMTLARAVEVRRPLIRSTNTGISTAILANGDVLEQSPINQEWAHTFDIKFSNTGEQSFYTNWGYLDFILWFALLVIIVLTNRKKGLHARS